MYPPPVNERPQRGGELRFLRRDQQHANSDEQHDRRRDVLDAANRRRDHPRDRATRARHEHSEERRDEEGGGGFDVQDVIEHERQKRRHKRNGGNARTRFRFGANGPGCIARPRV